MSKAKPAAQAESQSPADALPPTTPETIEIRSHEEQDKRDEAQAQENIKRWLSEWSAADLAKLYYFGQVLERNVNNAVTPIEDLITGLPTFYCWSLRRGHEFHFKLIQNEVNDAKEFFDDAIAITRAMTKYYPQTVAKEEE